MDYRPLGAVQAGDTVFRGGEAFTVYSSGSGGFAASRTLPDGSEELIFVAADRFDYRDYQNDVLVDGVGGFAGDVGPGLIGTFFFGPIGGSVATAWWLAVTTLANSEDLDVEHQHDTDAYARAFGIYNPYDDGRVHPDW